MVYLCVFGILFSLFFSQYVYSKSLVICKVAGIVTLATAIMRRTINVEIIKFEEISHRDCRHVMYASIVHDVILFVYVYVSEPFPKSVPQ